MLYMVNLVKMAIFKLFLERFKIPYTHSGVISSSIAMDKEISKKIFIKNKINTPKFIKYSFDIKNSDLIKDIDNKLNFL